MEEIDMSIICLKYRLYPTKSQQTKISGMLETCRNVYNSMLLWRKIAYETEQKTIGRYAQQDMLPVWKDKVDETGNLLFPELKDIYSHTLQDVVHRVDLAYRAFFRRCKSGETPGFPRFKGTGQYDSLTYTENISFKVSKQAIRFAKIGDIKANIHRPIQGIAKQCILRRQGRDWWANIFVEVEQTELPQSTEIIAMDLGLEKFAVLSNGEQIPNPRFFRKQEVKLAKAQRKLAKDKRNRAKKLTVSAIHKKTRNQRHNFIHQVAKKLLDRFETVIIEDLNVKNMSKRPKPKQDSETQEFLPNGASQKSGLNKSILDAAWTMFRNVLKQKAERATNRRIIEVNPAYTSQDCYICGFRAKKTLKERWHLCPMCGASLDRDENAALNLLALGTQRLGIISLDAPPLVGGECSQRK